MTIIAVLELTARQGSATDLLNALNAALGETRQFDGNRGAEAIVDIEDPHRILLIERWRCLRDDSAYRRWRASQPPSGLGELTAAPPKLRRFFAADDAETVETE